MAKRKTPKSQAPATESISPEAPPALSPEVAASQPELEPAIPEIFADAPTAQTPVAMALGEIPQASPSEEAVIADASTRTDRSANPAPASKADTPAARAAPWGTRGVYLRAASIALAVAFGAAVGSLAPVALERMTSSASADIVTSDPTIALAASIDKLTAEFAILKAEGAEADRSVEARVAALAERFDAAAKQQGELVARVAEIGTTVAARPTTAAAVSEETTGSVEPRKPAIADGWTLWRVHNGRALVEGHGRLYDIVPGADLPGLGPVQRIQRSEGRWIVVTQNGIIVSRRG